jgi:Metallo-beta-lactamase superfamily.
MPDSDKPDSDKKEVVAKEEYPKEVFKSEALQVRQISPNTYVHISYLATNDFGNVPCNGMIAVNGDKAIIFDATTTDSTSAVLIRWIKEELKAKPVALVVTHFHEDCLGGAAAFRADSIPSYAGYKTIAFTKENNCSSRSMALIAYTNSISMAKKWRPVTVARVIPVIIPWVILPKTRFCLAAAWSRS